MNITLKLTPEMAQKITDIVANRNATEEAMRRTFAELAAQIPQSYRDIVQKPRQAGFLPGAFTMHSNFDEPLPDAFWLGDEATDPIYATLQKS